VIWESRACEKSAKVVLSFVANRSSFLIGELFLGKLSETVVVVSNTPHDRPGFLVGHLIGNRASFLCTKAPMVRIPETNFLQGITSISGRDVQAIFCRRRHQSIDFGAQLRQSLIFGQTEVGGPQLLPLRQVCRPSCPPLYRHQHVVFQAVDRIGTTDGPLC
jgi:hypothetical protein